MTRSQVIAIELENAAMRRRYIASIPPYRSANRRDIEARERRANYMRQAARAIANAQLVNAGAATRAYDGSPITPGIEAVR